MRPEEEARQAFGMLLELFDGVFRSAGYACRRSELRLFRRQERHIATSPRYVACGDVREAARLLLDVVESYEAEVGRDRLAVTYKVQRCNYSGPWKDHCVGAWRESRRGERYFTKGLTLAEAAVYVARGNAAKYAYSGARFRLVRYDEAAEATA